MMKVLYFLEPRIELSAYFRYATLRNSILPQMRALQSAGAEPHVVIGDGVARRALEENLISDQTPYTVVNGDELSAIAGHYDRAAYEFLTGNSGEKIDRIADVIKKALPGDYVPDFVISWESPVPYLSALFPKATILYQWPGLLSRQPFPELISFDSGLLNKSSLCKLEPSQGEGEVGEWRAKIDNLGEVIEKFDPTRKAVLNWRNKFKHLLLLPLQVDNYFTVTVPLEGARTQLGVIKDVLRKISPEVGLVVTEYRSKNVSSNVLTTENVDYLRKKHSNFIFDDEINTIPQVSQYLARALDGTVTISSSVGIQAALWGKPLMCIGASHISHLASASTYDALQLQACSRQRIDRSATLHAAFRRMNVALGDIKEQPKKLVKWLEAVRIADTTGMLASGQWPQFYESNTDLLESMVRNSRASQLLSDVGYFSRCRTDDEEICKELSDQIDRREIISFDIFDTLLVRPFMRPSEMFDYMERQVHEIVGRTNLSFGSARKSAEQHAFKEAVSQGRGETTLDEIYSHFSEAQGLSDDLVQRIKALEIAVETQVLYRRKAGFKAYMQALSQKKRIVLVSDMYLSSEVLAKILHENGYVGYERLYVSSEVGVKKHSGRLFDFVLADLNVSGDSILHVGDNVDADVKMAKSRGIKAFHLTKASEAFISSSSFRIWKRDADRHGWEWRMPLAIVANEVMDNPYATQRSGTLFNGSPLQLGFVGAGPLILGFCKWIIERAIKQGYENLYFLARDGKVVKEVYDIIARNYVDAPKAKYLLCSRRAVNLAKVQKFSDIVDLIGVDYANKTKLGYLLENRFGLQYDRVDVSILAAHKYGWDSRVTADDRPRLVALLEDLQELIFEQAKRERENYVDYLAEIGFLQDDRAAVVDIGYAGTMQESLHAISGRSMLDGLYLMTFRQAIKRVQRNGMNCFGYLGDFVDRHDTFHPFCRYVPLYETLFSSQDTSFVRMERDWNGHLMPIYMEESPAERRRVRFLSDVHEGVLRFAGIYAKVAGREMPWLDFEPNKSIRAIQNCFDDPHPVDARIFVGLKFEDAYGGGGHKVILPDVKDIAREEGVWKKGREAILRQMDAINKKKATERKETSIAALPGTRANEKPKSDDIGVRTRSSNGQTKLLLQRVVASAVHKMANEKKLRKFERDPALFFADSKSPLLRGLGAIYK
ncbi:HAD superfamily hydrolase (TIGR01549 family) [Cupriavidus alkaliphilus]|uniref:HAD-IA family hydrolase n=1 Tax=Cupriavidus alkaliphilus TaxID=942866 RepID=UPI000DE6BC20|nr:HAD-IA family hydrolase [Cupriavidus alkaliphilus]PVY79636.1 HAD superfamily hydrolase (TIGR01549 family) [Cupriavidus alkaliphilus]